MKTRIPSYIRFLACLVAFGVIRSVSSAQPAQAPRFDPAVDGVAEVDEYYAGVEQETREYLIWSNTTFGRAGLWLPESAFDHLTPEQLEAKRAEWLAIVNGQPGRHQCYAIEALGAIHCEEALPALLRIATNPEVVDNRTRWLAVRALGRIGGEGVVPELIYLVDYFNENTRNWARASLYRLTGEWFGADREAWGQWWNDTGGEPPYVAEKRYPTWEEAEAVYGGQGAPQPMADVEAPESVPRLAKVPLQAGLSMEVEWVSLRGRSAGTLYQCSVVEATEHSVAYRMAHNNVLHTITDRVGSEYYTGNWSGSQDDELVHTWPWIPLVVALQVAQGEAGQTTVTLGDLVARQMREYLLVGKQLVPCMSDAKPVLVECWALVSGNGAALSVLAAPENPLVIESYEPGSSMQRILSISGPGLELAPLAAP